jgi:hypothetical protein
MTSAETLTLTTPRRNILLAMIACAVALALGLWFVDQPGNADYKVWSAIGIAILGIALILGALQLRFPPRLILTAKGFTLTGLIGVSIPWVEVERFFVYGEEADIDGQGGVAPHASWRLKDGAPSAIGMVATVNRQGGVPIDGSLPRNLGMAPEALVALMEEWRGRYGG